MKIKNTLGAVLLSAGLMLNPSVKAYATEPIINENYIGENTYKQADISALENFDKASAREIAAYEDYLKANQDISPESGLELQKLAENFGEEFEKRLELAKSIEILRKIDPEKFDQIIKESIDILNGQDLEKIEKQDMLAKTHIIEKQAEAKAKKENQDYSLSFFEELDLKNKLDAYLGKGELFAGGRASDDEILEAMSQAIINSRDYYLADEAMKAKYDESLDFVNKTKADDTKKALESLEAFVATDDKLAFNLADDLLSEDIQNISFNASNDTELDDGQTQEVETKSLDNPEQASQLETAATTSPFLSNEKTSSKYNELTDQQKRELDAIDTDNNGILSVSELDSSANYTSNIEESSWLYPFTEKAQNGAALAQQTSTETSQTNPSPNQSENTSGQTEQNQAQATNLPQTVTIDNNTKAPELSSETKDADTNKENEETDQKQEWSEAAASASTQAASIVKTGVESLAPVLIILLVAGGAYIFLKKNKK